VARLDSRRLDSWRQLQSLTAQIERAVDEALRTEWAVPLGWYDVLWSLQRAGGMSRPLAVADDLRLPPSSLTRRMDRLEEEGWIVRTRADDDDRRAIQIELTRTGRRLWREMTVTYRRAVQATFAVHLDDAAIDAVHQLVATLAPLHDAERTD
jgi:DNA-binding MarR family transcriptional regulator